MSTLLPTPLPKVSVAVIMLFQVSALFVREFVRRILLDSGTQADVAQYQSAWAGFAFLAVLTWPIVRDNSAHLAKTLRPPPAWVNLVVLSVAIGIAMRVASWGTILVSASLTSSPFSGEWFLPTAGYHWQCFHASFFILAIATMALMTPLLEEIINRGLILHVLLAKGTGLPILISSVLFAILHRPDSIPIAFLFGIVMAVQMIHCRSLWGPVIAHSTSNGMMVFDYHCFRSPIIDVFLSWLPRHQLASLGLTMTILLFLLSLHIAKKTGAGIR